jgi:predicted GIY-YIG superfamily endonuclease
MPPPFYYVYILRSETDPSRHYVGLTSHLLRRIRAHNAGQSRPHGLAAGGHGAARYAC